MRTTLTGKQGKQVKNMLIAQIVGYDAASIYGTSFNFKALDLELWTLNFNWTFYTLHTK